MAFLVGVQWSYGLGIVVFLATQSTYSIQLTEFCYVTFFNSSAEWVVDSFFLQVL